MRLASAYWIQRSKSVCVEGAYYAKRSREENKILNHQVPSLTKPWRCNQIRTFSYPGVSIGTREPDAFDWATVYFKVCFFFVSDRQLATLQHTSS